MPGPAGSHYGQRVPELAYEPKASGPFPCGAINQEFKQPVKRSARNNGRAAGKLSWAEFTPARPSRESVLSHLSNAWASQAENPAGNVGGPATMAGWVLNGWENPES